MNDQAAQTVWDYMLLHQHLHPVDAIFVLCSLDTRVAKRAAELYRQGLAPWVIVSGNVGALTKDVFDRPEAEVFAEILQNHGVPQHCIIIENRSTNTGENIQFTYTLLQQLGRHFHSFMLVQKPYMERRTYATFKKQWPDTNAVICVTSPQLSFEEYCQHDIPKEQVIAIMVGDLQRIKEYPARGFQIEQAIPDEVWEAYQQLVTAGFTQHLLAPVPTDKM